MSRPILYDYWRSSAAYRVRIALNLKGIDYESRQVDLREGEQKTEGYRALNPQGLVPMLEIDGLRLTQSVAIINYLDLKYANQPLIPAAAGERAHVVSMAMAIACDIHPLNNLRVLQYLEHEWNAPQPERDEWVRHWIALGFDAMEASLVDHPATGEFCEGDLPTLADCCLVPQVYNARRFGLDLARWPSIARIEAACLALPAFDAARPERQPDCPDSQRV